MSEDTSIELLSVMIKYGIDIKLRGLERYNNGIFYIYKMNEESSVFFRNESYSTSVFLSITVIEEVPKLHHRLFAKRNFGKTEITSQSIYLEPIIQLVWELGYKKLLEMKQ